MGIKLFKLKKKKDKKVLKVKEEKKDPNNLTVLEHAKELRIRLFISVIILTICFLILLFFSQKLLSFLTKPVKDLGYQLYFYKVNEAFFSTIKSSFFAALIISSPVWLWLILGFIIPIFDKKAKRIFLLILVFSVILLVLGFYFSYKVLIPISLGYLLSIGKGELTSIITIGFYLDFFLALFFATGVGFQLPLILLLLNKMGVIDRKMISKGRRYAIVIILIVGAALTPPDLVSQVILSVPIYLLYEIGAFLVLIFGKKEKKKET